MVDGHMVRACPDHVSTALAVLRNHKGKKKKDRRLQTINDKRRCLP